MGGGGETELRTPLFTVKYTLTFPVLFADVMKCDGESEMRRSSGNSTTRCLCMLMSPKLSAR